jgi:hypothetical protein
MMKQFSALCTPAKIYFILAVVSCVVALFSGVNFMTVGINLVVAFIWTAILGWFCENGFTPFSWALVLFPYVMMLLVFFGLMRAVTNSDLMMIVPPSVTQMM